MAQNDDLTAFVRRALTSGIPRPDIERVLLEAGWSPRQVREALAAFADTTFPVPIPKPRAYTDAREAFLYGLLFVALLMMVIRLWFDMAQVRAVCIK